MTLPRGLVVFGFGGHARSVADVAISMGIGDFLFVDAHATAGETFLGFPVKTHWMGDVPAGWAAISASGDGGMRQRHHEEIKAHGIVLATVVAPTATLGVGSRIGEGAFVGHSAHVGPMASVGQGCIINTGSIVEHECSIGDFTHVSVNATVAGRSAVGRHCMIGASATVIDSLVICDRTVIGAGAVVIHAIDRPGVYLGVPARPARAGRG
jgi:UDP-N-acetylbacillosamine N-acetyltransferase